MPVPSTINAVTNTLGNAARNVGRTAARTAANTARTVTQAMSKTATGAAKGIASNIRMTNVQLASKILDVIKKGNTKANTPQKLAFWTRGTLNSALKNLTNPSKRAKIIDAVSNAIVKGTLSIGTSATEIVSAIVAPIMGSKTREAEIAGEVAKENVRAKKEAYDKYADTMADMVKSGKWNAGLTVTPAGDGSTTPASDGTGGSFLTPGSMFGG